VAVGMAGITSDEEASILQSAADKSERLVSIPYSEVLNLTMTLDSNSRKTLELQFLKRRSLIFLLDKNQFDSLKLFLPTINELQDRLKLSSAN
jgi:hypothetical protein